VSRLEAAIFDLDGLLIDSEPLWHEAEVLVLGPLGVPVAAVGSRHTKGMVVDEVTRYWHERYPWQGPSPEAVARHIDEVVEDLVVAKGVLRPGALAALEQGRARHLAMALASSSRYHYLEVVLEHFGLSRTFDVVHSAQDEVRGKPDPAVFLGAAGRLWVVPAACVVFEDSPAGVAAAKAAGMRCLAVPAESDVEDPMVERADVVVGSLVELDESLWRRLESGIDEGD
jgi:HAD superfamily hydrolase (TIGR01509 family)